MNTTPQKLNIISNVCTRVIQLSNDHTWTWELTPNSAGPVTTGTLHLNAHRDGDEYWFEVGLMEAEGIMSDWEDMDIKFAR